MNQSPAKTEPKREVAVITQFRGDLEKMRPQFSMAMPPEKVDRFIRTIMTAMQTNPNLFKCSRQSLLNACMKAAQDDLLPDGREGVLVPFGDRDESGGRASDTASWMPMIAGLRKKARNSGEISDWYVEVVHQADEFFYELGDEPRIIHRPNLNGAGRKSQITHVYSVAKFKDGTLSRHVMPIQEVEDIRARYARARKGPWSDPIAYPEMVKKTCARQHAKILPSSTDLDAVLRRDDHLFDLRERGKQVTQRQPASAMAALEQFAAGRAEAEGEPEPQEDFSDPRPGDSTTIDHDTDEVLDHDEDGVVIEPPENPKPARQTSQQSARQEFLHLTSAAEKHPPRTAEVFKTLARGVIEAAKGVGQPHGPDRLQSWWSSDVARKLRNGAGMTAEDTDEISREVKAACEELRK